MPSVNTVSLYISGLPGRTGGAAQEADDTERGTHSATGQQTRTHTHLVITASISSFSPLSAGDHQTAE